MEGNELNFRTSRRVNPRELHMALKKIDCAGQPELTAVRDWLLAGLSLKLPENSRGDAAIAAAAYAFFCKSGTVDQFITEVCEIGIADGQSNFRPARISERTTDLHAVYVEWCSARGMEPISLTAFGRELSRLGFPWRKSRHGRKFRQGLRLRTPDPKAA